MPDARDPHEGWEWPDALDALSVAPKHHRLLFKNDDVRVLDTRIGPGETVPVHTHRWPGVLYVLSSADFVRRDGDENVILDSRSAGVRLEAGAALWTAALPPQPSRTSASARSTCSQSS